MRKRVRNINSAKASDNSTSELMLSRAQLGSIFIAYKPLDCSLDLSFAQIITHNQFAIHSSAVFALMLRKRRRKQ